MSEVKEEKKDAPANDAKNDQPLGDSELSNVAGGRRTQHRSHHAPDVIYTDPLTSPPVLV
jgi:hypothetical protein